MYLMRSIEVGDLGRCSGFAGVRPRAKRLQLCSAPCVARWCWLVVAMLVGCGGIEERVVELRVAATTDDDRRFFQHRAPANGTGGASDWRW